MKGLKNSLAAAAVAVVLTTAPLQATEYGFGGNDVIHKVPEPQYPTALFLGMGLAGLWGFRIFLNWQEKRSRNKIIEVDFKSAAAEPLQQPLEIQPPPVTPVPVTKLTL